MDAIQEVASKPATSQRSIGQAGGGYFNFTMKSGTNQYHGSALRLFGNESSECRSAIHERWHAGPGESKQQIRNVVRRNDYGFTIGGPVRHSRNSITVMNKSFFFGNFEQFSSGHPDLIMELPLIPNAGFS